MTKVNRLGWRNFVSGVLAVLVGLIPVFIYCLSVAPFSYQTSGTIAFLVVVGLGFGIIIGAPLELFVVHRFTKSAAVKTIGAYLVAGAAIDLAINIYWWAPAFISSPQYGMSPYFFIAMFLMIFIVYSVTAVIARLTYPLIHRLLWRVSVPYGSPVVAEVESAEVESVETESTED